MIRYADAVWGQQVIIPMHSLLLISPAPSHPQTPSPVVSLPLMLYVQPQLTALHLCHHNSLLCAADFIKHDEDKAPAPPSPFDTITDFLMDLSLCSKEEIIPQEETSIYGFLTDGGIIELSVIFSCLQNSGHKDCDVQYAELDTAALATSPSLRSSSHTGPGDLVEYATIQPSSYQRMPFQAPPSKIWPQGTLTDACPPPSFSSLLIMCSTCFAAPACFWSSFDFPLTSESF